MRVKRKKRNSKVRKGTRPTNRKGREKIGQLMGEKRRGGEVREREISGDPDEEERTKQSTRSKIYIDTPDENLGG